MPREGSTSWGLWLVVLLGLVAGPGAALYNRSSDPGVPSSGAAASPAAPTSAPPVGPQSPAPVLPPTPAERREARAVALLRDALGGAVPGASSRTFAQLAAELRAAQALEQIQVATLIVSLPDPRRSLMSVYFDQTVETLVNAVAQVNMTKDRHLFPWGDPAAVGGSAGGAADDPAGPGIMIFRAPPAPNPPDRTRSRWLVAFLVGESPVLGARDEDVQDAVRWALALQEPGAHLRVVGPYFSGSARSLALGLQRAAGSAPRDIITGTATEASIGALFAAPGATFQRTVPLDTELLQFLTCEVARRQPGGVRMAVLSENGTVYGSSIQRQGTEHCGVEVRNYVFPQHISKLRATHQRGQKDADDPTASVRRTLELKLDAADGLSPDTPRTFSPLAPYESDLLLRQLLQRICADETDYLVLTATDPADIVFLAQQARLYCPGVSLGTLSADVLFTHPDLRATFSGLLVASPYPLVFDNAALAPRRQRTPFPSDIAAGFYNATLAGLAPLVTEKAGLPFVNYRSPGGRRTREVSDVEPGCPQRGPQLWLAMVANNAYWPLEHRCAAQSAAQAYVPGERATAPDATFTGERRRPRRTFRPTELAGGLFVLLLFVAAAQLVGSARDLARSALALRDRWRARSASRLAPGVSTSSAPTASMEPLAEASQLARGRYRLAQHLTLACLLGLAVSIGWRVQQVEPWPPLYGFLLAGTVVGAASALFALAFGLTSCAAALRIVERALRARARGVDRIALNQAMATLFAAALMIWLGGACSAYQGDAAELRPEAARLLVVRSIDPLGMSPLLPFVYLACGCYAWGSLGVRRLAAERRFADHSPFPGEVRHEALQLLIERIHGLWRGRHILPELCSLAALALPALYFWQRLMPTFEGHAYDRLLRGAFLILYASVVFACVKFALSWRLLARFLRQLAAQPMSDAYDRVALKVAGSFGLQFTGRMPDAREFDVSAYNCRLLASLAGQLDSDDPHGATLARHKPALARAAERVEDSVRRGSLMPPPMVLTATSPAGRPLDTDALQAEIHDALFAASASVYTVLAELWDLRVCEPILDQVRTRTDYEGLLPGERNAKLPTASRFMRATSSDIYLWTRMAEDFVAMRVVTFVQQIFFLLRNLLIFALTAALALILAVASYPLQPARFVTVFAWFLMIMVTGVALFALIAMERDEILSRLGGSGPGTLSLNVRFVGQLFMYVALPAAVLIASVFPEVSEVLFAWLEPLARLLP